MTNRKFKCNDPGWEKALEDIALGVDKLILTPENLKVFQEQIAPYVGRRQAHLEYKEQEDKARLNHWQKVKANPAFQDKHTMPADSSWEWDSWCFLSGLPMDVGPEYEMPAKRVPELVTAISKRVQTKLAEIRRYSEGSTECQRCRKAIRVLIKDITELNAEYDALSTSAREIGWIKTPIRHARTGIIHCMEAFEWRHWFDIPEESVFGCWRPPLGEPVPDPYDRLWDSQQAEVPKAIDDSDANERYYIYLTAVHDVLSPDHAISEGIWDDEEQILDSLWFRFTNGPRYGPGEHYLKKALVRVKDDLAKKPTQQEPPGEGGEGQPDEPVYIFQFEGASWRVVYGAINRTVRPTKGMYHIRHLLKNAGQHIECLDIEKGSVIAVADPEHMIRKPEAEDFGLNLGDIKFEEMTDDDKQGLKDMLATAKNDFAAQLGDETDPSQTAKLKQNISMIQAYLNSAFDKHGNERLPQYIDKVRKRVSKAIHTAMKNIEAADSTIGQHFNTAINPKGSSFIYLAEPKIDWDLP